MSVSKKVQISKMLRDWRQVQAATEGVELYRVLQNVTINEIADTQPQTNIDLLAIKGLGPKKVQKYGQQILDIVGGIKSIEKTGGVEAVPDDGSISVGEFISRLNFSLAKHTVRVHGEVFGSVDIRGKAMYFKIKDSDMGAILSCFAWTDTFADKGTMPTEGAQVVLEGQVQIYPPTGRFSLQVKLLELRGEGLLKQAFEKLKKELEVAGAFDRAKKRSIVGLPRKIAVITATGSDAETDFKTHVGQHGLTIHQYDVRVEGIKSESQIVAAVKQINQSVNNYDVVVITRGGGSLESLQAYNSKSVVEAVQSCRYPVISAVGHERDITLCDLVADIRTSTPTDAGKYINNLYVEFFHAVRNTQRKHSDQCRELFKDQRQDLNNTETRLTQIIGNLINKYTILYRRAIESLSMQIQALRRLVSNPAYIQQSIAIRFETLVRQQIKEIKNHQTYLPILANKYLQNMHSELRQSTQALDNIARQNQTTIRNYQTQISAYPFNHKQHMQGYFRVLQQTIDNQIQLISAFNPQNILQKGYAYVTDGTTTVKKAADFPANKVLNLEFIDGNIKIQKHHD